MSDLMGEGMRSGGEVGRSHAATNPATAAAPGAPARSVDPRVILVQIVLAVACGFCLNRPAASVIAAAALACMLVYLGCRRQAALLLVWTVAVNLVCQVILLVPSWGAFGMFVVFFVLRKAVPLVGAAVLFLNGLTVSRLVAVLTLMRLPKAFVLTLAVAYRFIPTIGHEVAQVRDALAMRGRPLTPRSFLAAPREMTECVLVPLMMRCTRVADELAASATTRAIENPAPRTSRHVLRMRPADWAILGLTLVAAAAVVAVELAL